MRTRPLVLAALAASLALSVGAQADLHAGGHADGLDHDEAVAGGESYTDQVMHHIADANEFHVFGDLHLPLPILAYSFDDGLYAGLSSDFYAHDGDEHDPHAGAGTDHGHHPTLVREGYFLDHGELRRLADPAARASVTTVERVVERDAGRFAVSEGRAYAVESASSLLAMTGWIDFSITKNVATMLLAMLVFALIFIPVANGYKRNAGRAPTGLQSFFEPIILFVRDDIAREMIGPKWERYFPYLATLFFFILIVNLFGLIPVAPFGANATGNIALTLALAAMTFLVVNLSGNRHYWGHIFWMPGVPVFLKPIMAAIEFLGIFIKPFTLMIRLFANITAGHIIILSLIGLIFVFGDNGESVGGATVGAVLAVPFVLVMNILELFVAFLQAFIFTLLTALYIGAAVEEHHHGDDHGHADSGVAPEHDRQLDGAPAPSVPA